MIKRPNLQPKRILRLDWLLLVEVVAVVLLVLSIISIVNILSSPSGQVFTYLPEQIQIQGPNLPEKIEVEVEPFASTTIPVDNLSLIRGNIPDFITENDQGQVIAQPNKSHLGDYSFLLDDEMTELKVSVLNYPVDMEVLITSIENLLGDDLSHFGIYIEDLTRRQGISINGDVKYPPASISKLPSVGLALRDIDSGKYSFDTQFMVQDQFKHTSWDSVGKYPHGSMLPLRYLIDAAILESNNSAHYHLHSPILGGMSEVQKRTKSEFGVDCFSLDPHLAQANDVGAFMVGLYRHQLLSDSSSDYLIDLLIRTPPSLKEAIPAGIPDHPNVQVANKVGFLFGGREGNTYSDSAIVYGRKTDYVLVVLNDQAPPYPNGKYRIQDISKLVYDFLDSV